jgi:hypothetical protein
MQSTAICVVFIAFSICEERTSSYQKGPSATRSAQQFGLSRLKSCDKTIAVLLQNVDDVSNKWALGQHIQRVIRLYQRSLNLGVVYVPRLKPALKSADLGCQAPVRLLFSGVFQRNRATTWQIRLTGEGPQQPGRTRCGLGTIVSLIFVL